MYETFGSVVIGNTVDFRLFFPDNTLDPSQYTREGSPRIQRIQIAGDFQGRIGG